MKKKKKIKEKKRNWIVIIAFRRAITMKIGKSGIVCWKFEKKLLVERRSQTFGNISTSFQKFEAGG